MRSLSVCSFSLLAAVVFFTGCDATVPGLAVPQDDPLAELKGQYYRDVQPLVDQKCISCHNGSRVGIGIFEGDEPYDSVKAWPAAVNVNEPLASRLITKGPHEGPAWLPADLELIEPWLINERDFAAPDVPTETNAIPLVVGDNEIDLGDAGLDDMAGTLLRFRFDLVGDLLQFTAIRLVAPPTGATVEGPVFSIQIGNTRSADPLNSFGTVKANIAPGDEVPLGGGILYISHLGDLLGQAGQGQVSLIISFKSAIAEGTGENNEDPFACRTIGGAGGEWENFQTVFSATNGAQCNGNGNNCHSGNSAAAGLSVAGFNSTDEEEIRTFCRNIRSKLDITNPTAGGNHALINKANAVGGHSGGNLGAPWSDEAIAFIQAESLAVPEEDE